MSDYREHSQSYARGAINASAVVNGGAAIALLSQYGEIAEAGLTEQVARAMQFWIIGIFVSGLAWIAAFASARYVDRSLQEGLPQDAARKELQISDRYMYLGVVMVVGSFLCFFVGALKMSVAM